MHSTKLRGPDAKKVETERLQAFLHQLLKEEDNKYCADCEAKQPRWASWNLGVFLCIRCAGLHRNLGVHVSKVKSITLDSWSAEQVQSMRVMGNAKAKAVYECDLPPLFRRPQSDQALESFIRAKYDTKRYIMKDWAPPEVNISDLPPYTGDHQFAHNHHNTGASHKSMAAQSHTAKGAAAGQQHQNYATGGIFVSPPESPPQNRVKSPVQRESTATNSCTGRAGATGLVEAISSILIDLDGTCPTDDCADTNAAAAQIRQTSQPYDDLTNAIFSIGSDATTITNTTSSRLDSALFGGANSSSMSIGIASAPFAVATSTAFNKTDNSAALSSLLFDDHVPEKKALPFANNSGKTDSANALSLDKMVNCFPARPPPVQSSSSSVDDLFGPIVSAGGPSSQAHSEMATKTMVQRQDGGKAATTTTTTGNCGTGDGQNDLLSGLFPSIDNTDITYPANMFGCSGIIGGASGTGGLTHSQSAYSLTFSSFPMATDNKYHESSSKNNGGIFCGGHQEVGGSSNILTGGNRTTPILTATISNNKSNSAGNTLDLLTISEMAHSLHIFGSSSASPVSTVRGSNTKSDNSDTGKAFANNTPASSVQSSKNNSQQQQKHQQQQQFVPPPFGGTLTVNVVNDGDGNQQNKPTPNSDILDLFGK